MSRALLVIAFAQALGRQPTDQERTDFLAALAEQAGGEYLYIPKLPQSEVNADEVWKLRGEGKSVREIADRLGCSRSPVMRVLHQPTLSLVSPYEGDKEAA